MGYVGVNCLSVPVVLHLHAFQKVRKGNRNFVKSLIRSNVSAK